jgi:hypothetical protein
MTENGVAITSDGTSGGGIPTLLPWQRLGMTVKRWAGHADSYIPKTIALFSELAAAQTRAREVVDLDSEAARIRSRVGRDLTPVEAERELTTVEKGVVVFWRLGDGRVKKFGKRKQAVLADFEAAAIERAILGSFSEELLAAWPVMRARFDALLIEFKTAIASVGPKVTDAKVAEAAGGAVAHQWHLATAAMNEMSWLWQIADDAREAGVFKSIRTERGDSWRWDAPGLVPSRLGRGGRMHSVAHMRRALEAGVTPMLASYEEVRERLTREAAEAAQQAAANRQPVGRGPMYTRGLDRDQEVDIAIAAAARRQAS